MFEIMKEIVKSIYIFLCIISLSDCNTTHIILKLNNGLFQWYSIYVSKNYCSNNLICEFVEKSKDKVFGNMYNELLNHYKQHDSNTLNIDVNLEPHQRWPKTHSISEGKDRDFQFAITYRLFYTKYNFPMSYFNSYNSSYYINLAKRSLKESKFFERRNAAVAVYGKMYRNRNKFIDMISKYITVDKYGSAFHNPYPNDKIDLLKKYKFCIAIENSIHSIEWGQMYSNEIDDYYVTEKLLDCFKAGSIPIYFGPKNARLYFPNEKSVIFSGDFKNYEEMMKYIESIKDNEKELKNHISWPNSYSKEWFNRFENDFIFTPCRLCEFIKYYYIDKNHDKDVIKFDKNDGICKIK